MVNIREFGAKGDGQTDDWPVFEAAKRYMIENRVGSGSGIIMVPPGVYSMSRTFEMNEAGFGLIGPGAGMADGNGAILVFEQDQEGNTPHGIIVGRHDTSGLQSTPSHGVGGDGARIEGLQTVPRQARAGASSNGITALARCIIRNCKVDGWSQDGIHVKAPLGNANGLRIEGGTCSGNARDGLHVENSDANALTVIALDLGLNGRWGIFDLNTLGNVYIGCQSAVNGWSANGVTKVASRVYHKGWFYLCKIGRDEEASVTEPGTDETVWESLFAGPGPEVTVPQWDRGEPYQAGGAYGNLGLSSRSLFLNCYSESGQPPTQLQPPAFAFGGLHAAGVSLTTGAFLDGQFLKGLRFINPPGKLTVELAFNSDNGDILAAYDQETLPHVNRLRVDHHGDVVWSYDNSFNAFRIIQPGSPYRFGTQDAVPGFFPTRLFIPEGGGNDGRRVDYGHAPPPPTEDRGHADVRINMGAGVGDPVGWYHVRDKPPYAWVPFGIVGSR